MKELENINSPEDLRKLPLQKLPQVAAELRDAIVGTISKNGGHLGSSLGATDLIVALHYAFNTPHDKLVFDTGHQAYAHKLLTGRRALFHTIRQKDGLSGFLRRDESEYDAFGAGHASTAISAALGMAVARDQRREQHKVVAIVSDGCMTGGMAFEALQNAGQLGTDLLVVLNDNQMFISHRVGALGAVLTKLLSRTSVRKTEQRFKLFLKRFEAHGRTFLRIAKRARVLFFPGMLFEEMGFAYYGPIDGHDTAKLISVLSAVKDLKGPVLLHVVTKKGKGYTPAEQKPIAFHGLGIFDKITGEPEKKSAPGQSYTKIFSNTMLRLAQDDPRVVAITAAMPEGTGLDAFRDRFPARYYDVGIAEEHAATFAAGLACEGLRPVVAVYSSFSQRCYDQILHDICLQKLPVVFALDRAGIVGEDGPTHHGVFDLSFLRSIPGLVIMAPSDENELQNSFKTALSLASPCVIRYPRGIGPGTQPDKELSVLPFGKGVWKKRGKDLTILAAGNRVQAALEAAQLLQKQSIDCGVADLRFIKPLDAELLEEALAVSRDIVTVEDNALAGGAGSAVLEHLNDQNRPFRLLRMGVPDNFIKHGKPEQLYEELGLTGRKICETIAWRFSRAAKTQQGEL